MPFWYFLKVPNLGHDASHQSNVVEVCEYLIREGEMYDAGTPIVTVENYWATMRLSSVGRGLFRKSFFDRHESVRIGDPIGIFAVDGDDLIYDGANLTVEVLKFKQPRPKVMKVAEEIIHEARKF